MVSVALLQTHCVKVYECLFECSQVVNTLYVLSSTSFAKQIAPYVISHILHMLFYHFVFSEFAVLLRINIVCMSV